jgi:hypothetical protein
MGQLFVRAKLENLGDVDTRKRGLLLPEEVRAVEVPDALVDTAISGLLLPKRLIAQLGLRHYRTRHGSDVGTTMPIAMPSAVWLTIDGRGCALDVIEVADDQPVSIGQLPLRALGLVVDGDGQRLIGKPAHGGKHIPGAR